MGFESLSVSAVVQASADRIYASWLDSEEHGRMTGGGSVHVEPRIGSGFSARAVGATGRILELEPGRRIVQSWRTTDFNSNQPDSRVELHLRDVPGGCEVMILHMEIPQGLAAKYEKDWRDRYLLPMTRYFGKSSTAKHVGPASHGRPSVTKAQSRGRAASRRVAKR